MSFWDAVGDGLFFQKNGVAKLLDGDDGLVATLDGLLREDEFIQETQAQSPKLIDFLRKPDAFEGMLRYIVVAQDPANEDFAYRFPYMVCEAFACAVPGLLDELATDASLRTLFSLILPSLRQDLHPNSAPPQPYVLGYWAKVVGLLCKRRPGQLIRFLSLQPGIAAALVAHLHNGSVATLLGALLRLPFSARYGGMARLALCSADPLPLPALLLAAMRSALESAGAAPGSGALAAAAAAGHAAAVVAEAAAAARSARPHAKYLADGYNAARTSQSRQPAGGGGASMLSASSNGDEGEASGSAGITPAAAWRRACLAWPCANGLTTGAVAAPVPDPALSLTNTQVDAAFHSPAVTVGDSGPLRLVKWLRDGGPALGPAPGGPDGLVAAADRAVALLASSLPIPGSGATAPKATGSALAACCEPPLVALAAVLDTAAYGFRQQAVAGFGLASEDPLASAASATPLNDRAAALGPAPALCEAAAACLPAWVAYLSKLAATGAAAHCPGGGPLPATLAAAEAAVAAADAAAVAAPAPSYPASLPLGTAPLALARVLAALLRCAWPSVAAAAAAAGLPAALLDLSLAFPWHSVLHGVVAGALGEALAHAPPQLLAAIVAPAAAGGADLPQRVAAGLRFSGLPASVAEQYGPPKGDPASPPRPRRAALRAGYGGHLASLANALIALQSADALPLPPTLLPSEAPGGWWSAAVLGPLAAYNIAHGVLMGGALAPDSKKTGQVGAAADATARPAAVDEVAALGAAPSDGDGEGGDGSGSDGSDAGGSDEGAEGGETPAEAAERRRRAISGDASSSDGEPSEGGVGHSPEPESAFDDGEGGSEVDFASAVFSTPPGDKPITRPPPAAAGVDDWDAGFGGSTAVAASVPQAAAAAAAGPSAAAATADDWDVEFGSAPTSGSSSAGAPAASSGDHWAAEFDAPGPAASSAASVAAFAAMSDAMGDGAFAPAAAPASAWGTEDAFTDAPSVKVASAPSGSDDWGAAAATDDWGVSAAPVTDADQPAPAAASSTSADEWGVEATAPVTEAAQPAPAAAPTAADAEWGVEAAAPVNEAAALSAPAAALAVADELGVEAAAPVSEVAKPAPAPASTVSADEWGVEAAAPATEAAQPAPAAAPAAASDDWGVEASSPVTEAAQPAPAAAPASTDEWDVEAAAPVTEAAQPAPFAAPVAAGDELGVDAAAAVSKTTSASTPALADEWGVEAAPSVVAPAVPSSTADAADDWGVPATSAPAPGDDIPASDEWGVAFPSAATSGAPAPSSDEWGVAFPSVTTGALASSASATSAPPAGGSDDFGAFDDGSFDGAGGADGFTGPPSVGDSTPLVSGGGVAAAAVSSSGVPRTDDVESVGGASADCGGSEASADEEGLDAAGEADEGREGQGAPAGHMLLADDDEDGDGGAEDAAVPAEAAPSAAAAPDAAPASAPSAPAAAFDDGFGWGEPLGPPPSDATFDDGFGSWDAAAAAAPAAAAADSAGAALAFDDGDWGASFGDDSGATAPQGGAGAQSSTAASDWGADDWGAAPK